jgi:hypothetical protein
MGLLEGDGGSFGKLTPPVLRSPLLLTLSRKAKVMVAPTMPPSAPRMKLRSI